MDLMYRVHIVMLKCHVLPHFRYMQWKSFFKQTYT